MDGGAGNMPRSNPPRKEVLLTKAKIKLNQRGLIVKWADYTPFDGLLGKGAYGKVLKVRKNVGNAEYAVKVFNGRDLGQAFTHEVLSELKTLFKVKKGWHACDRLDDDWCPIVQVHGLFEDISVDVPELRCTNRCGLLMELYGVSLHAVLHKTQHELVEAQRGGRKLPDFENKHRITVAHNVASACRYLHDVGIMHRDLKDCNVLVDPFNGYRAKLTDFGTSKNTRQVIQQESAGTTHTLAPEALLAQDPFDDRVKEADKELDYRAIDVYAYGILLCALWDKDDEQLGPRRHIPLPAGTMDLKEEKLEREMYLACKDHVRDMETYPPHGLRPAIPPMLERHRDFPNVAHNPDPKRGMPPLYVKLMDECWRYDPDERPSFSGICKRFKQELREEEEKQVELRRKESLSKPVVPVPASERLRVMLNVSYCPKVAWEQSKCVFTLNTKVESHGTITMKPTGVDGETAKHTFLDGDGVDGDKAKYTFPFLVSTGDSVSLQLSYSLYDGDVPRPEDTWVGEAACSDLLTNIQGPQVLRERKMALEPYWDAPAALTQKAATKGAAVALIVKIKRTTAAGVSKPLVNLGVLQVELLPKDGVPRLSSVRKLSRVSTVVREDCSWKDNQVFISYRESETGLKGSNFAFRLQEALESVGYSVFCYGALFKVPQNRWISPFTDGVQLCQAFIPICSPEYGDLDLAPWCAAELLHAVREQERAPVGWPRIIPIRHHGAYPPSDEIAVIAGLGGYKCVPDQKEYRKTPEARRMKLHDVWQLVIARLEDAGIKPVNPKVRGCRCGELS